MPLWKNEEARARLETWYQTFLERVEGTVECKDIETSYGTSRVLLYGDTALPPLLCLHAMRTGAAHLLSEIQSLAQHYYLIVPDLPDQSVYGLQLRLSIKDETLAHWVREVLDACAVDKAAVLGVSWGGFVARLTASTYPQRIQKLVLLVAAGLANGSHWIGLTRMAWPLIRYRFRPSEANLRRVLDPLVSTWDPIWVQFMADSLSDIPFDGRIPPLATDAELQTLSMPTLVLAADEDISFPGQAVLKRVQTQIPQCETELLKGMKHCTPTTDAFREWLTQRVHTFLSP